VRQGDRQKIAYSADQAAGWARNPAGLEPDKGSSMNHRTGQHFFNGEPTTHRPGDKFEYTGKDTFPSGTKSGGGTGQPGEGVSGLYKTEHAAGIDDARAGRPRRLGQTAGYRKGYSEGLSEPMFHDRVKALDVGKTATLPNSGVIVRRVGENEYHVIEPPSGGLKGGTQVFRGGSAAADAAGNALTQERRHGTKSGGEEYPRTDLEKQLVAWARGEGEKPPFTTHNQEKQAKEHVRYSAPFKGTHTYHPGLMDLTSPTVIQGKPIEKGAEVRIMRGGRNQEKLDPLGKLVWIQDANGNVQSVWKAALKRGRKLREVAAEVAAAVPRLSADSDMATLLRTEEALVARLPLANVLVKHGKAIPEPLREELRDMLDDVATRPEMEAKLAEAREREDARAISMYETLVEATS
jgi:hypothetical protein